MKWQKHHYPSGDLLGAIGFDGDGNSSRATEASAGIAAFASQDHSATEGRTSDILHAPMTKTMILLLLRE